MVAFRLFALLILTASLGAGEFKSVSERYAGSSQDQPAQSANVADAPIPLSPGQPVKRDLQGRAKHSYLVDLGAGQFAHVVTQQFGIDLIVSVNTPDGKLLYEVNNSAGPYGDESISISAETGGGYQILISAADKSAPKRSYEIRVNVRDSPTQEDESRLAAERRLAEGQRLQSQQKPESRVLALKEYEQAAVIFREIADRSEEANALHLIAGTYKESGDLPGAEKSYRSVISLRREANDRQSEGYALIDLAAVYRVLKGPDEAIEAYLQAYKIFQEVGNISGQASSLYNVGLTCARAQRASRALTYYEQALQMFKAEGDLRAEMRTINAMGGAYELLGELDKALELYDKAVRAYRELKDPAREANAINNISKIYDDRGQWQRAMDGYNQALAIYRDLASKGTGALSFEGSTLYNLGYLYISLGDVERALEHLNNSLRLRREANDKPGEGRTVSGIGYAHFNLNNYDQALKHFAQALTLQRPIKDPRAAETLTMMGMTYLALKEYKKAEDYYRQALEIQQNKDSESLTGQAITLDKFGQLYSLTGDQAKAFDAYKQALQVWRRIENRDGEALTLYNLALVERDKGDYGEADNHVGAALDAIESLRRNVIGQHLRTSYLFTKVNSYELAIDVKMRLHQKSPGQGYDAAALRVAERARARNLMESLVEARAEFRQGVDSKLLEQELSLQRRIASKAQALIEIKSGSRAGARVSDLEKEIDAITAEFHQVQADIRRRSPQYAALTQPQLLDLDDIQTRILDEDTVLLEYSLGEERSYLWVVTKSSLSAFNLPKRSEIEDAAKRLCELVKTPQIAPEDQYRQAARRLSEMALGQVGAQIEGKRLLIVADGALQYVPFAILPVTAKDDFIPLVVEHEIINLPSATTLAVIRQQLRGRSPALKQIAVLADPVFDAQDERVRLVRGRPNPGKSAKRAQAAGAARGNQSKSAPDQTAYSEKTGPIRQLSALRDVGLIDKNGSIPELPLSGQEARAILGLIPSGEGLMATGFQANMEMAQSAELGRYRIVHFATHGVIDDRRPELSGLLLSMVNERGQTQDGFLGLNSVYSMKLSADLVVLSACQTGLGKDVKGEGLVGLTRGFMYAGAPRVVASLWQVRDDATRDLMKLFYQKMIRENMRPAEALRAAQVEIMKQKNKHSPFFWGAFVIQGEWK